MFKYGSTHTTGILRLPVLPGFVYGPYAPPLPLPSNSTNLGTNGFIYALLSGGKPPLAPPWVVDVRDVARAHVLALELPPVPTPTVTPTLDSSTLSGSGSDQPERDRDIQSKRIIINAGNYTWPEAIAFLKQHPGLEDKVKEGLTDPEAFGELPGPPSRLDNTRAREMLNMEFIAPEKTIEETVRVMLQLEASWAPTT
ncbi:hypothetical protein CC1G_05861 [Coprinopsis cinerea okayama7|uniref:NAD-dependent epimerase/dehydratase domain-containing protein n=1 Tax=Coprinopsis cinerea (strain Okayama-7 / 130 / ATCC MYA-4618 / FGSC 9003) TaxID=240176 RepID=A8NLM1_COPC7|nr:hypothetical protein CC1G_05861 [Coprinopsis cinerea okayama7\|eukprot:XP_001834724.1 hypothetical protein CC1G_05861 [Coprinopsis cinerea okayama7\